MYGIALVHTSHIGSPIVKKFLLGRCERCSFRSFLRAYDSCVRTVEDVEVVVS